MWGILPFSSGFYSSTSLVVKYMKLVSQNLKIIRRSAHAKIGRKDLCYMFLRFEPKVLIYYIVIINICAQIRVSVSNIKFIIIQYSSLRELVILYIIINYNYTL